MILELFGSDVGQIICRSLVWLVLMKTNQICPVDSSKGEHDHCLIPVISHSPSLNSINVENLGVAVDAEILNSHCSFDSGNFSDLWSKRIGGPELMGLFKSVLFHKGGLLKRMTSEEFYDLEKVQKKNRDAQDQGERQQEKETAEIVSEKDTDIGAVSMTVYLWDISDEPGESLRFHLAQKNHVEVTFFE